MLNNLIGVILNMEDKCNKMWDILEIGIALGVFKYKLDSFGNEWDDEEYLTHYMSVCMGLWRQYRNLVIEELIKF